MSTTPDPTPVDPDLNSTGIDPTPVEPPEAEAPRVSFDPPLYEEPLDLGTVEEQSAADKAKHRAAEASHAMREADLKALYAAAGATEALVGAVRETVTETERWARAQLSELKFRRKALAKQAEEMRQRAEGLPEDVKAVPEVAKSRVADLQEQATGTYSDLANRGQRVLQDVRTDVVNRIDPAFDRIQQRVDAVRRALRGAAAPTPTPTAPVAETTPESGPAGPVDDLIVEDAVLVEDVTVEAPEHGVDDDRPLER
jgi:chromosome segregation ATPase